MVAVYFVPIQVRSVVVASLIILLPGMSLTAAVRELSSQDLVSGTARMAGAMAVLLKLAFGTVAATQVCALFGLVPPPVPLLAIPAWTEWVAVPLAAVTFAITFRSPWRYLPARHRLGDRRLHLHAGRRRARLGRRSACLPAA